MKKSLSQVNLDSYSDIVEDYLISAAINDHEIKQEENFPYSSFVLYRVDLYSSIKNWYVLRRYSNFKDLFDRMSKHIHKFNMPEFPEKKFFNLNEETINKRKGQLENFINFFLEKQKLLNYKEILDFFELDKETLRLMLNNRNLHDSISSYRHSMLSTDRLVKQQKTDRRNLSVDQNYFIQFLDYKTQENSNQTAHMLVIEEFLNNLETKYQNKTNVIKTFENFLKSKKNWPLFKTEEISRLYFGENDRLNHIYKKGLLEHIGSIEQNPLGAEECLFFLAKLLDFEFNPDCEKYIYIIKSAKFEILQYMSLKEHLSNIKGKVKKNVYCILKAIYDDKTSLKIKRLLNDPQYKEFQAWLYKERLD